MNTDQVMVSSDDTASLDSGEDLNKPTDDVLMEEQPDLVTGKQNTALRPLKLNKRFL